MVAPYDPTCLLDLRMLPYMDGATQRIRDFSGRGVLATPTGFAGTDVEYVDGCCGQGIAITNPKRLVCGQVLNYTFESFTFEMVLIVNVLLPGGDPVLFWKGNFTVNGYYMQISNAGAIAFMTNQGGALQQTNTNAGCFKIGNVQHIIVTRDGARVRIYYNGTETAYGATGVHISPTTSANDLLISTYGGGGNGIEGTVFTAKSWVRCLGASEVWERYIASGRGI